MSKKIFDFFGKDFLGPTFWKFCLRIFFGIFLKITKFPVPDVKITCPIRRLDAVTYVCDNNKKTTSSTYTPPGN